MRASKCALYKQLREGWTGEHEAPCGILGGETALFNAEAERMKRMAAEDPKTEDRSWEARWSAANAASEAREWQRAAKLLEALRATSPHDARCWLKAGEAWCEAGEFDSADLVLQEAVSRFPNDHWIAHCHARVARRRADWPEMLRRSDSLRQNFPDFWPVWIVTADALAALGRHAEAVERRREAAERV